MLLSNIILNLYNQSILNKFIKLFKTQIQYKISKKRYFNQIFNKHIKIIYNNKIILNFKMITNIKTQIKNKTLIIIKQINKCNIHHTVIH